MTNDCTMCKIKNGFETLKHETQENYLPKDLAVSGFFCIFASYLKIVL